MIRTRGLTKRFGAIVAVDGIDLDVREGDIYGFLGANGSGKTTTVRMLLGLVLATSGSAEVLGRAMPKQASRVLPQVGALVESPAAYPRLSGRANLRVHDALGHGSRAGRAGRVDDVLERVGLGGIDERPVAAYSLGMRQRLGLAHALLGEPRLLVLDEPTNGLDPQGIREIRQLLLDLNAAGTTIFLSSHLLAEIEQLATRVGVLDRGRLVIQEAARRAAAADRAHLRADARRGPGPGAAGRPGRGRRRREPAGPRPRRGRAQRPAGRGRRPRHRAGAGAAHARGRRAGRDHGGLGPVLRPPLRGASL